MKKIIFTLIFLNLSFIGFSQTTVSGVVTYFFNDYQGNKPDIGASVILIDSAKTTNFDYKLYENYHRGEFYQEMYLSAFNRYLKYSAAYEKTKKKKKLAAENETYQKGMEVAKSDMDSHQKEMVKLKYDTNDNIAKTQVELFLQLLKLDEDLPKKTVDANGNYSIKIEPGVYYVYIKSKNRTGSGTPETDGKIYIKKIKIAENQEKDVSYNFEL